MGAHQHHGLCIPAGNHAHDVVGNTVHAHLADGIQGHRCFSIITHDRSQRLGIGAAHGKGGCIGRAADILGIQGIVADFPIAAVLNGNHGGSPPQMGFIGRVVDPPVFPLVDIDQDKLVCHIQSIQICLGALAAVNHGEGLCPVGNEIRLVSSKLRSIFGTFAVRKGQLGFFKRPGIQGKFILGYVLKADALHFRFQHIAGGKLRFRPGCSVA